MNCGSWHAGEIRQLANRREWLLLEAIKNGLINNGIRRFFGGVAGNRRKLPLTQILGHRRICDRIPTEHSYKFVVDGLSRKSFDHEKQANRSLIH
jgi:hypothetical protein